MRVFEAVATLLFSSECALTSGGVGSQGRNKAIYANASNRSDRVGVNLVGLLSAVELNMLDFSLVQPKAVVAAANTVSSERYGTMKLRLEEFSDET